MYHCRVTQNSNGSATETHTVIPITRSSPSSSRNDLDANTNAVFTPDFEGLCSRSPAPSSLSATEMAPEREANRVSLNLFQERAKEKKTQETNVYIVLLDQWLRLPPRPTGLRRHLVLLACVRHQEPCNSKLGRTRVHRMVFSHSLRKLCLAYPSFLLLSLLGLNSSLLELVQPSDVFVATSLQCITEACLVVLRAESLKLLPKDY